jgi:D-alanine-D-alanine ligase
MTALRVAVAMGGTAAEREVSLRSGQAVLAALAPPASLDGNPYDPLPLVGERDGRWSFAGGPARGAAEVAAELVRARVEVVFIALHGPGGEDGTIQGFLEVLNIPYTGPGVASSSIAMDKVFARSVLEAAGLRCAPGVVVGTADWRDAATRALRIRQIAGLGFPLFVKAPTQGSSFGVSRVEREADVAAAVETSFQFGPRVLAEKGIAGVEVTAPTLGNSNDGELLALPPVEIRPTSGAFFDYNEKYSKGGAEELCPPRSLSEAQVARVKEAGALAHRALQCDGMSRTDMIVAGPDVYVLEVNTIPGLTERSLLPQAAAAAGISFPELVGRIIRLALHRRGITVCHGG